MGGYVYIIFSKPVWLGDGVTDWVVFYVGSTIGWLDQRSSKHSRDGRWLAGETFGWFPIPATVHRKVVESLIWEVLRPRRNRRDPMANWSPAQATAAWAFLKDLQDDTQWQWLATRALTGLCRNRCGGGWCGGPGWCRCGGTCEYHQADVA